MASRSQPSGDRAKALAMGLDAVPSAAGNLAARALSDARAALEESRRTGEPATAIVTRMAREQAEHDFMAMLDAALEEGG